MTQISTAARRITRYLNSAGQHWAIGFTNEGRADGHVYGQNVDVSELADCYIMFRTFNRGGRYTQRQVQFALDAMAAAVAYGDRAVAEIVETAWSIADEYDRPRPTVEQAIRDHNKVVAEIDADHQAWMDAEFPEAAQVR